MGIGVGANVIVRNMPHAPADVALVKPAARAAGRVRVPGDKSISHRYAMLAALADGRSTIRGYLTGADCLATLGCLRHSVSRCAVSRIVDGTAGDVQVEGRGLSGLARRAHAARRRQLRDDDAAAVGHRGRTRFRTLIERRRLAQPPPDATRHRAAHRDGRGDRIAGRPAAAHDRRRAPARHHPSAGSAERAGQERGSSRRSAGRRRNDGVSSPCQRAIIRSARFTRSA